MMVDSKSSNIIIKGKTPLPEGELTDYNRPNHRDFMTSSELKKDKFSGIRENSISQDKELWIEGECVFRMSLFKYSLYPEEFEEAYARVFKLEKVETLPLKGN